MWITLIMMLISYFMSAKSGNSKGKSAAVAATVGLGTYWATQNSETLSSANESISNALTPNATDSAADTANESTARPAVVAGVAATAGSTISSLGSSAAGVLTSWGPKGTLGVVAGTTAVTSVDENKWLPIAALGIGAFMLLK